jgi:hypothetical protein
MVDASTLERRLTRGPWQLNCPACGDNDPRYRESVRDRYGLEWLLRTCARCGVEWQMEPITTEARKQFYGSGEYRRLCEQVTGKPWTDEMFLCREQDRYAERWMSKLSNLPEGHWLDYGGSTGVVSHALASGYGEPGARSPIVIAVADYGDGAWVTPEEALTQGPYDAVLCCQTLDHLPNPLEILRTFRDITRDGGKLFVDVVKKDKTAYKVDHDTYWPSASCFAACVERAGWVIDWLDGETDPVHWAILAHK